MITLTNSIFKAFMECPARAMAEHGDRVTGDPVLHPKTWEGEASVDMACGSLIDAMVTKGFRPSASDKSVMPSHFFSFLKSSYDDGMKNASLLCNKSGGWNAKAVTAINAGNKLIADPAVQSMLGQSLMQKRISFMLDADTKWEGDIDMLWLSPTWVLNVIDLKAPSKTDDAWVTSMGKNVKAPWYDAWGYWFQLAGYCHGLINAEAIDTRLDGVKASDVLTTAFPSYSGLVSVSPAILFCTREEYSKVGMVNIAEMSNMWLRIITAKNRFFGVSKLDTIKSIVSGNTEPSMCGDCDYCKSKSKVECDNSIADMPIIDDSYGVNDLEFE